MSLYKKGDKILCCTKNGFVSFVRGKGLRKNLDVKKVRKTIYFYLFRNFTKILTICTYVRTLQVQLIVLAI
jgi:hypothetical protein